MSGAITRNRTVHPVSPTTAALPFSDYMRSVYRISEEGALESQGQREKLLQSRPDLSELAACAAADGTNRECRVKLADAYIKEGLLWSAYTLFNEVLKLDPDDFQSTLELARIWDEWKDYSMARPLAETAITMRPESADAHAVMGNIELHRNEPAGALAEFKKNLELVPDNAVVTANLGYTQMLLHNWSEARAAFERALSLDATMMEARNNLGIVLAQMGDYDGAFAQMQQVVGPAVAYNNLGVVLLIFKKEPAAALHAFEQALRYAPDYDKARANLQEARALLPSPVVIHLPPRQGMRAVAPPPQWPMEIDLAEPAKPISEHVDHVNGAALPAGPSRRSQIVPAGTLPALPRQADHLTQRLGPASTNTGEKPARIFTVLGILDVIVMTSVTSRWILSRGVHL